MFDRRKALSEVFIDTQLFYRENSVLAAAVEHSKQHTRLFLETEYPELPEKQGQDAKVAVTKFTSFGAARLWKKTHPDHRVAVLNFASAVTPGGGVKHGSSAQEESLCRCSTLYPTLDQRFLWDAYYNKNRNAKNVLHTDDCIWSPEIIICKTDESIPNRMEERNWVTVDVISCAAPNLRQNPNNFFNPEGGAAVNLSDEDLYAHCIYNARNTSCTSQRVSVSMCLFSARLGAEHLKTTRRRSQKRTVQHCRNTGLISNGLSLRFTVANMKLGTLMPSMLSYHRCEET